MVACGQEIFQKGQSRKITGDPSLMRGISSLYALRKGRADACLENRYMIMEEFLNFFVQKIQFYRSKTLTAITLCDIIT